MQLLHLGKTGEAMGGLKTPDPLVCLHEDEGGEAQADRAGVDPGFVAEDDAQLFELAQALEDGRGHEPKASTDLCVRGAGVLLKYSEDLQVDRVQRRSCDLLHTTADSVRAPRASTRPWTTRSAWSPSGSRSALSSVTTRPLNFGAVTKTFSAAKADSGSSPLGWGTSAAGKSVTSTSKWTRIESNRLSR